MFGGENVSTMHYTSEKYNVKKTENERDDSQNHIENVYVFSLFGKELVTIAAKVFIAQETKVMLCALLNNGRGRKILCVCHIISVIWDTENLN